MTQTAPSLDHPENYHRIRLIDPDYATPNTLIPGAWVWFAIEHPIQVIASFPWALRVDKVMDGYLELHDPEADQSGTWIVEIVDGRYRVNTPEFSHLYAWLVIK